MPVKKICKQCDKVFFIRTYDAKRGRGKFCGRLCSSKSNRGSGNPSYKHGNARRGYKTKEYSTWANIKSRTSNPLIDNSKYYLGKGIKMCDRWFNSFEKFLEDMGEAPSPRHSIDRIDYNGDYEPDNCRWVTHTKQMRNTSRSLMIKYKGKTLSLPEWCEILNLDYSFIYGRLRWGWSVKKAFETPKTV